MKKYKIKYDKRFIKELEKIPSNIREKLKLAIEGLKDTPRPSGCIKLTGYKNLYRIRVGDYRVGYEIHDQLVVIVLVTVAHRRDIYKNL